MPSRRARRPASAELRRIPAPEPAAAAPGWLGPALAALAAVVVYRGALGYDFTQDDFAGLGRAAGILPRLRGPWRYLSGQAYFDVMRGIAGLHATAYHAVSLAVHAGCGALLAWLLARVVSRPAATLGAVWFVTHPALFTAIYSVSGIGEILAGLFALTAIGLSFVPRPRDLASPAAYGLSLLCKESTILLPAAAAFGFLARPGARASRRTLALGGGLLAVVYAAWFVSADVFRVRTGIAANAAYALAGPLDIGRNLLTYLGWTANMFLPSVHGVGDAVDPNVFAWGAALALLWLAGLAWPALRARGWAGAGIAYLLLLVPVLGLRNHTYHYYLYMPLTAAATGVAALADALLARAGGRRGATIAAAAALLFVANGALLVRKIETAPFVHPDMRADATVDRARIVRNVRRSLESSPPRTGERIVFWSPELAASRHDPARASIERYWEANLRAALMEGVAVRVLFPQVDSVRFVDEPGWQASDRVAMYQRTGVLTLKPAAEVDSMLRQHPLP